MIFLTLVVFFIVNNHPELNISVKGLYNYINQQVLLVRDIDLKRKVKFKPRKNTKKGGIEQVHTLLRMILPKGTVFEYLTQWDIRKCMDHINSYPREKLGGMTPYMLALEKYGPDMLRALRLKFVEPDTVNLTPSLLK